MKSKPFILLIICLIIPVSLSALEYQVGSSKTYKSPNALYLANIVNDGDTISIDAEDYIGIQSLARWSANNLLIRGIGGKPHLKGGGKSLQGKGIWVIAGNDDIIENLEFSGASVVDNNGAGIRFENLNLIVRSCYFHDNE